MMILMEKVRVALKMYPPSKLEQLWYRIFPGKPYTRWNRVAYFFGALVGGGIIFTILNIHIMVEILTAILVGTMVPTILIGFIVSFLHNRRFRKMKNYVGITMDELEELIYAIGEENK